MNSLSIRRESMSPGLAEESCAICIVLCPKLHDMVEISPRHRAAFISFIFAPSTSATHLCLGLGLLFASQRLSLRLDPLLSPLAGSLGLCTLGVHFVLDDLLTLSLSFGLVDLHRISINSILIDSPSLHVQQGHACA